MLVVAFAGAAIALKLWLNHIIPDKPPAFVTAIMNVPESIKETASALKRGDPPSIDAYRQNAEAMRRKYGLGAIDTPALQ